MHLRRLLGPVFAVGLLACAVDASAGSLVLRDEAQIFTPADVAQLRTIVTQAPFDARLVTTASYADQAAFSRFVGTLVSEPDMVVVGIDPQHHHVQVHFGTASHIPEADWPAIEHAGNDAFKRAAWEEGGADIFRAASAAVSSSGRSTTPVASPAWSTGGSFLVVGLVVMLVIGLVLAAILFSVFRRRSPGHGGTGYGVGGFGGGGYGGGGPYPGGQGPYYGPGGAPGGMGPLGGGLIGAGLGGVAGYELGKMEGEREQRNFDQGSGFDAGGGSSAPDNGSFDAGGGGSSWDDSGSSGGGGGDFGGGGGDSGGGGSDF